jgi:predicted RNase H-like nuclease (RuvC/YqgF family)
MISRHCRCPGCGICEAAEAIEPLKKERTVLRKSLKEEKQRYEELYRITESYIKRLHASEKENKRLKEALQEIADCDCPLEEDEYGYKSIAPACRKIADKILCSDK